MRICDNLCYKDILNDDIPKRKQTLGVLMIAVKNVIKSFDNKEFEELLEKRNNVLFQTAVGDLSAVEISASILSTLGEPGTPSEHKFGALNPNQRSLWSALFSITKIC